MQPEQLPIRTSFFDDDDLNLGFNFRAPEKCHQKDLNLPCAIKDTLIKQFSDSSLIDEGFYALHNKTLVRYKSSSNKSPVSVLDLSFSRVQLLLPTERNPHYGFALTKNGVTHELFHPGKPIIEDWFECLKKVCVLGTFHDEYKAHKMIGKGSFAKVYYVESKTTGKKYAVKAFAKESVLHTNKNNAKPSMLNEIDIMRSLDHENIIKLFEVHETERSIYLVLELIQGRSLQEVLRKPNFKDIYTDVKISIMIRSILDALAYLASKGIMHRDLKPENILLDKDSKIKIADFGLATYIDVPEYIFKKCGTPGYIAPEVFKYDPNNPMTDYDHLCDTFSAGCIFFYMLFRIPFFDGSTASEILRLNRKFNYDFSAIFTVQKELMNPGGKMSKDGLKLLLKLLEFDPKNRISAAEALCHPYFAPFITKGNDGPLESAIFSPTDVFSNNNSPQPSQDYILPKQVKNTNPFQAPMERFAVKDSLYLDIGRPEINGRVDTINGTMSGNHHSLLLQKKTGHLNPGSGTNQGTTSGFAKLSIDRKSKSFKVPAPVNHDNHGNHGFLKAAIIRNMQKNNNEANFQNEDYSPEKEVKSNNDSPKNQEESKNQGEWSEAMSPTIDSPNKDLNQIEQKVEEIKE